MPRFPGFPRRKAAVNPDHVEQPKGLTPSFNVLPRDRGKLVDGGAGLGLIAPVTYGPAESTYRANSLLGVDDANMFSVLKNKDQ